MKISFAVGGGLRIDKCWVEIDPIKVLFRQLMRRVLRVFPQCLWHKNLHYSVDRSVTHGTLRTAYVGAARMAQA